MANTGREIEALGRIFDRADGKQWDYVFNCGGETRYSQEDEVYKLRSLGLSLAVAKEAAKRKVKAFVELSTGMVYKSDSSPSKEEDKLKPWSKIAVYKLQAEEELAKIEGYVAVIPTTHSSSIDALLRRPHGLTIPSLDSTSLLFAWRTCTARMPLSG